MLKASSCSFLIVFLSAAPIYADPTEPRVKQDPKPAESKPRPKNTSPTDFNLTTYGGSGLILAVSPYTLEPGQLAAGGHVMNFDRNPGDIDFFEFSFQAALGLPGRSEVFFRFTPTLRNDAVALHPLGYPVPPLDLFIDTYPNDATRRQPIFLFAQETPYKTYRVDDVSIRPPGNGAFASSTGDVSFGGKVNLLSEERGDGIGLGVRGSLDIATETSQPRHRITTARLRRSGGRRPALPGRSISDSILRSRRSFGSRSFSSTRATNGWAHRTAACACNTSTPLGSEVTDFWWAIRSRRGSTSATF